MRFYVKVGGERCYQLQCLIKAGLERDEYKVNECKAHALLKLSPERRKKFVPYFTAVNAITEVADSANDTRDNELC